MTGTLIAECVLRIAAPRWRCSRFSRLRRRARAAAGEPSFYRNLAPAARSSIAAAAPSMISGYRANNGLGAVTRRPGADEARRGAVAHHGGARQARPRRRQAPSTQRLKARAIDAKVAAENIGAGYHTLAEAFSGWRDSPPHRANMLIKGATRMGIAAVYSPKSKYKVFWTLILAAPDEQSG